MNRIASIAYHTFFLLLLTLADANGQHAANTSIDSLHPAGQLVDIGGYRLHIHCSGQGKIPVVLVAGSMAFSFDWSLVQDKLSKEARVCSYDRPGLAWSDAGPMPRSMDQDVYELHTLLQSAHVSPPYVLVGHSIGGLLVRRYARQYPAEVSGMVLIDATSENAMMNMNGKIGRMRLLASGDKKLPPVKYHVDTLTKVPSQKETDEMLAMMGPPAIAPPFDKLPPNIQGVRLWAQRQPKYYIADADDNWAEEFAEIYSDSAGYSLDNKPLFIVYSSKNEYPEQIGQEMRDSLMTDKLVNQQRLCALSGNSKLVTTSASGHEIFLTEPELIVSAIRQVIAAVEHKSALK